MKKLLIAIAVLSVAACSSQASRMADCESQGISRDACYTAEQNRQATMNAAAEKQALENAHNAVYQHAQAAHVKMKPIHKKGFGVDFKRSADGFAYLDSVAMAVDEDNADATTYFGGLYQVIQYKNTGKTALIKEGKFLGYLK